VEFLLLTVGLVAGYFLGRWRRDVWARDRIAEVERAWAQKLRRGDEAFLARLRTVETELEIMRARARQRGSEMLPSTPDEPSTPKRRESDPAPAGGHLSGTSELRPIDQVMGSSSTQQHEPERAPDDFTELRGIGPKTAEQLIAGGVRTYSQLAALTPEAIKEILADGSFGVASADPESWPAQATLASEGRWLALRALQAARRSSRTPAT
jgi:hypothetical protein